MSKAASTIVQAADAPVALWRNRDYMLLWTGQLVSILGSGISGIAVPLLILALTGSPAIAGLAGAVGSIPYLVLSLPAGALIDRWDRKRVMIVCDAGRALTVGSIPLAAAFGHLTVAQLFVTTAVEGAFFVFFNIAETACLPRVVPASQLPTASAQNEGGSIAAGMVAPPLGGFLYQAMSHTVPFVFDALSYAASVVSLSCIRTTFQDERTAVRRRLRTEIAEGLRWLWGQPLIRYTTLVVGVSNGVFSGYPLIVIVLARQQHASPAAIGLVFSIASVGGLLGAFVAPRVQRRFSYPVVVLSTLWMQAVLWPLLALAPNPICIGLVAASIYTALPSFNAVVFSYRLRMTPDRLQGRVTGASRLVGFGFQPIGAALSGFLLQCAGTGATVLVFAGVLIAIAMASTANPHVRHPRPV